MAKWQEGQPQQPKVSGIQLNVVPTNVAFDVELQRAPDVAGVPGTYAAIQTWNIPDLSGQVYTDYLPLNGAVYWYRTRHVRAGYTPGAFTTAVSASAKDLGSSIPLAISIYPLVRSLPMSDGGYAVRANDAAGKELADDLYIAASKTLKVGTAAAPATITKTLRIPYAALTPWRHDQKWEINGAVGYANPGQASTVCILSAAIPLPKGVTLTAFRTRHYRNAVGDFARSRLYMTDDTPTLSQLAENLHSSTGYQTQTTVINQLVGNDIYTVEVSLTGLGVNDARFVWCEVDYTMPSYDKAY